MDKKPYTQYILQLAEKWLDGTISPEEEKEFTTWYYQFDDEAELHLDKAFARDEAALKQRIYAALDQKLPAAGPARRVWLWRTPWLRVAAAAVFTGMLATGAYWYVHRSAAIVAAAPVAHSKDLPPGGNKAILTLANGRQVVLDQAANGALANQAGVTIVKLDSGLLAYEGANGISASVEYNILTTPRGGQYQLQLPDGTRVWLNSASSLRFPTVFCGKDRRVELEGEAYFEVARNAEKPFILQAGNVRVNVLGTSFDVMAYRDEAAVKTTLVSGSVKVEGEGRKGSILQPGELGACDASGELQVRRADLKAVLAWKEGEFRFSSTSLADIMRQIARWYDVDVVYKGDFTNVVLSGVISRKQYVSQLLEALEITGDVHFLVSSQTITVLHK